MAHAEKHPQAGQTVSVQFRGGHFQIPGSANTPQEFVIEDWWDHLTGQSWMVSDGNPACIIYAIRSMRINMPMDDDVIYGHVGSFGHLVHISEIV